MSYEDKFQRAEQCGENGNYLRIDDTHPVGIFLGLELRQRAILIVCPTCPPTMPSLASIALEIRPRQSGEFALVLRLIRPQLKALFTRLVEDLDSATRQRPENPGEVVIARLTRWQRLLSSAASDLLSDEELRGLAGELDFLLGEAIPAVGPQLAVVAWRGPFDAPKDFVFNDREVEIKSTQRQSQSLMISSLEQLSDAGLPLCIWTRVVELSVIEPGTADSLLDLVNRARNAVSNFADAAEALDVRLRAAMWDDRPEYAARGVRFGASMCYTVNQYFPRIQRQSTPATITSCRYELSIANLLPFKIGTWRD